MAFLSAALLDGTQPDAFANVQGADSFRGIEFMTGHGQQIDVHFLDVDGPIAYGLHGIRVEIDLPFPRQRADLGNRLDRAHFIVGEHDADQDCFRLNRISHRFDADPAKLIHR